MFIDQLNNKGVKVGIKRNKRASRAFFHWSDQTTFLHLLLLRIRQCVFWGKICERRSRKMSGAGKKIADVAFKASRTIDWDGMAKVLVTDEARREFSNLRRAFDEVNTQLQTKFSQVLFSISPSLDLIFSLLLGLDFLDLYHFDFWIR